MPKSQIVRLVLCLLVSAALMIAGACATPGASPGATGAITPTRTTATTPTGLVTPPATVVAGGNCAACHNETPVVLAGRLQWGKSLHGSGEAYLRSTAASCAGCHSHEGFAATMAAGQNFSQVRTGVPNPTQLNCRTCHRIHQTYTASDWTLRTVSPVTFFINGTFDGGNGNLCANCHQPRMAAPRVGAGTVNVTSVRWGPHHGVQATCFIGTGGYGVEGSPSVHYATINGTCTACHMENNRHEMTPTVSSCQPCHNGTTTFDYKGVQTEVKAKIAELKGLLETKGLLKDDLAVPGNYTEAQAGAVWNYLSVTEDGSFGVHNPAYFRALLQKGLDGVK